MIFGDTSSPVTTALFVEPGTYVLRLTADDGVYSASDDITITVNAPATNNLANWLASFNLGGQTGFGQDTDGDGICNALENYSGTDPSSASNAAVMSNFVADAQSQTFIFRHPLSPNAANDILATYRWSPDLGTFHGDGASDGTTIVDFSQSAPDEYNWVTVTATITGPMPARFFTHIQVSQQP